MVLEHFGVPEFDAPDNYDPIKLRGDHILKFKVILPEYDPNSDSKTNELIKKLLEMEQKKKHEWYGFYESQTFIQR